MPSLGNIYIGIKGDTAPLRKDFATAESLSRSFAGRINTALSAVSFVAIAYGIKQTADAFLDFEDRVVTAASDLTEVKNKINAVFGAETASTILAWSTNSATAIGLSQRAALDAVGTMGNMWEQLGASSSQAARLSQEMVGLSSDISSFHNVTGGANEVLLAMQSAFRGEYDALQRYIPTITAATVQQQALVDTGKSSAKELTALDKALAAQKIIMQSAGAAVGDFANTSEQLANQQRILEANTEDLSAKLGDTLLPIHLDLVRATNAWIEANGDLVASGFGTFINSVAVAFRELNAAAAILLTPLRQIVGSFAGGAEAIGDFFEAVEQVTSGVRGLDGELNATRNGAQVYVGAINDVRFAHEEVNESIEQTGPIAETAMDRADNAIANQAGVLRRYAEEGRALGEDLWLRGHAEEAELAMSRANTALVIQRGQLEIYAQEGERLGRDMWLVYAEGAEDARDRANSAVIDVSQNYETYIEAGTELGDDMWLAYAEGSEAARDRALDAIEEQDTSFHGPNGFFAGVNEAWDDMTGPGGSMTTWADVGYGLVRDFTYNSQRTMSDNFFDWITGKTVTAADAWEDMWKSMLRDAIEYIARIVAEWATVELLEGASTVIDLFSAATGAYDVPEDMLMWVHAGEMVVPAETAGEIRDVAGGDVNISPFSPTFDAAAGQQFGTDFAHSIVGRYVQAAIAGGALTASGYLNAEQLASALTSVDFAGVSLRNSFVDALKASLGLTGGWSKIGSALGKAGAIWGGFGPVASLFGVGGAVIGDAIGDLLNARENESMRDFFEDMYGYIGGRTRFRDWYIAGKHAEEVFRNTGTALTNQDWSDWYGESSAFAPVDQWGNTTGDGSRSWEEIGSDLDDQDWSDWSGGNFAGGGIIDRVAAPTEDGLIAAQLGEGVVSKRGMRTLERINQGGFGGEMHIHLHVDGREIGGAVIDQLRKNGDLVEAIRSLN